MFAALIAAAVHDYKHPGRNSRFLLRTDDSLSILYSDSSVLERMHVAEAFFLCRNLPECDIFDGLGRADYLTVRKTVVDLVIATDLQQHYTWIGKVKGLLAAGESGMSTFCMAAP